jgi:hypothetical protein
MDHLRHHARRCRTRQQLKQEGSSRRDHVRTHRSLRRHRHVNDRLDQVGRQGVMRRRGGRGCDGPLVRLLVKARQGPALGP